MDADTTTRRTIGELIFLHGVPALITEKRSNGRKKMRRGESLDRSYQILR